MSDIDNLKRELRGKIKALRREVTAEQKKLWDKGIFENIVHSAPFENAGTVLIYKSTAIETGTELIIKKCFEQNKRVALPRCKPGHKMDFYFYDYGEKLEISRYGIAEPFEAESRRVKDFNGCLCIVPGQAFDRNGYRLGYGGGYYDRFLGENKILSAGICYEQFVVSSLPKDEFDRKVDFLVTEKCLEEYNG